MKFKRIVMDRWYKDGPYWRRRNDDGRDGTGDLIYNTLTKIIMDEDKSCWAIAAYIACTGLLIERKRWPDRLNRGDEVGLIGYYLKRGYCQTRMSRDPFIALGACFSHLLGAEEGIYDGLLKLNFELAKPPWYLYRPNTWRWRKRLLEDSRELYVIRLSYLRAYATKVKFDKERKLWKD